MCVLGTRDGDLKAVWYSAFTLLLVCSVDTRRRLAHLEIGEWRCVARGWELSFRLLERGLQKWRKYGRKCFQIEGWAAVCWQDEVFKICHRLSALVPKCSLWNLDITVGCLLDVWVHLTGRHDNSAISRCERPERCFKHTFMALICRRVTDVGAFRCWTMMSGVTYTNPPPLVWLEIIKQTWCRVTDGDCSGTLCLMTAIGLNKAMTEFFTPTQKPWHRSQTLGKTPDLYNEMTRHCSFPSQTLWGV